MPYDLLEYRRGRERWSAHRPLTRTSSTTPNGGAAMQSTQERWLPIPGYEGMYEASDHGRIRSLDRTITRNGRPSKLQGRVLTPLTSSKYGYLKVGLGRGNLKFVHRLVAESFLGDGTGLDVDHRDGDPTNNHLSNLRYLTHAENMRVQRERKPRCQRGHSFEDAYWSPNGRRNCRTCLVARDRRRRATARTARS